MSEILAKNDSDLRKDKIKRAKKFHFPKMYSVQEDLLAVYRLSDDFRREYGNEMIARYPEGQGVKGAIKFIKKFKGEDATIETHRQLIIDMLYTRNVLGFYFWEYFSYGLENLSPMERIEFISEEDRLNYYSKLNPDKATNDIIKSKWRSYEAFREFYKRDIIQINGQNDSQIFKEFCVNHNRFMTKPVDSSLGKGIMIFDVREWESLDLLLEHLLNTYGEKKGKAFLCEELIVSEDNMAKFHPESVNSVRIFTYCDGTNVTVPAAWLKVGRGDAVVDNGGAGGLVAAIDVNRGILTSHGRNEHAETFALHPDTDCQFKGFQVPRWEEAIATAKEAAMVLPKARLVGWDIALSKEKGWQIIEGNSLGMFNVLQVGTQKGMRDDFEASIEWHKYKT